MSSFNTRYINSNQLRMNNIRLHNNKLNVKIIPHPINVLKNKKKTKIKKELKQIIHLIGNVKRYNINTSYKYDSSFKKYSTHKIIYYDYINNIKDILNINNGILLISYTIIHPLLNKNKKKNKKNFEKLINFIINSKLKKLFIIQDEYYDCDLINNFITLTKPDIIYTCLNEEDVKTIYRNNALNTKFNRVLTGYVENRNINKIKIKDRTIDVFYRGGKLHYYYGRLGYLKYHIGDVMRQYSEQYGLNHDIHMSSEKRIYGIDWYNTLLNSKVTLGTLSGSNVINRDYTLRNKICNDYNLKIGPNVLPDNMNHSYNEIFKKYNIKEELNVGQLAPKMFEAIEHGTVLVLFEGNYSDILIPDIHYISLKEDLSNIEDVMNKIKDNDFLQNMADKAFDDIVKSMKYSYKTFINNFDKDIDSLS